MPRKPNAFWEAATVITDLMNPDARLYDSTHAMNRNHLSMLCGKKAQVSGETVYDVEDVVEAFRALKAEFDEKGLSCGLLTLLKGSPKRHIDRLLELPERPAIWDAQAFDDYVRKYAKRLRKSGFKYTWADEDAMKSRISYEEAKELGLVEE